MFFQSYFQDMERDKFLKSIADKSDADIFLFSGGIDLENVDKLILEAREISDKNRRNNAVLILTTFGGSADDAYRLIIYLKKHYKKIILLLFGFCKSAGTLIALGCDEIVYGDFGELGALDVQIERADELTQVSALSYYQSLIFINKEVFTSFEDHFIKLKQRSGGNITTKTAAEIATKLACGIMSPIAEQIEPLKLGEIDRANKIAMEYGNRIFPKQEEILQKMILSYPSHVFVINFEEAKSIFGKSKIIRETDENENALERILFNIARMPDYAKPTIGRIYPKLKEKEKNGKENGKNKGKNKEKAGKDDRPTLRKTEQKKLIRQVSRDGK